MIASIRHLLILIGSTFFPPSKQSCDNGMASLYSLYSGFLYYYRKWLCGGLQNNNLDINASHRSRLSLGCTANLHQCIVIEPSPPLPSPLETSIVGQTNLLLKSLGSHHGRQRRTGTARSTADGACSYSPIIRQ